MPREAASPSATRSDKRRAPPRSSPRRSSNAKRSKAAKAKLPSSQAVAEKPAPVNEVVVKEDQKKRKFEEDLTARLTPTVLPPSPKDEPPHPKKPCLVFSFVDDNSGATLADAVHTALFTPQSALKDGDIQVAVPKGRFIEFFMILREHQRQCERSHNTPDVPDKPRAASL